MKKKRSRRKKRRKKRVSKLSHLDLMITHKLVHDLRMLEIRNHGAFR